MCFLVYLQKQLSFETMAKGSFFTFVAGAAIGAAAVFLTLTKEGEQFVKESRKVLDKYSSDLKEKFNCDGFCEESDSNSEN